MSDLRNWRASLSMRVTREAQRSVVRDRIHRGPLRVLKALYPEGEAIAHVVIVHPPAGVAVGDQLSIDCRVEEGAHGVISTPGAQKWYRANDKNCTEICAAGFDVNDNSHAACATTTLHVADDALLEWLPQEAMVYDGCVASQEISFELAPTAKLFAWEMLMWGRAEMDETFRSGRFRQSIALRRKGEPLWTEHANIEGGSAVLHSPTGFGGRVASGNVWIAGVRDPADCLQALRALCANVSDENTCGATLLPNGLIVLKSVAHDIESLRSFFVRCRAVVRPFLCSAPIAPLRIWQT